MANCCDYSLCEGLATIGFMRSLIPSEMSSCVPVSAGTTASTCCGNMSEDNYIPKYSEISGGTFANLRVTASTPSNDVNGFTYVTPTPVTTNCCTGDTLANEALMKSQLGFEYTSAVTCSHINVTNPTHCSLNYGLTVKKEWDRHRYECDANSSGNIKHTTTRVTDDTSDTRSGCLDRTVTEGGSGNRHEYTFSFNSVTISSETTAQCSEEITASTTFSASTYTKGFSLICPGIVPCEGGEYTIATIDQMECDGEISLEITCNIEGTPETYTLIGSSGSTGETKITIGENHDGRTGGTISVKATVWGYRDCSNVYHEFNYSCPFDRDKCEIGPEIQGECGELWNVEECWKDQSSGIKEYYCNGSEITCNKNNS